MRELPPSSREAKNHPKKCDLEKRFLIHLAESRLQLLAITQSAGLTLIILQTCYFRLAEDALERRKT